MANVVCWDHDGTVFRIYSNGSVVLETPLNPASGMPLDVVVIDPSTGLPATFSVGSGSIGLPTGHIGDLLWHDGTNWVVLAASGADTYVLTQTASGGHLIPSWQPPRNTATPVPVGPALIPARVRCAVADYMTQQFIIQYNFFASFMSAQTSINLQAAAALDQTILAQLSKAFTALEAGLDIIPSALITALTIMAQAQNTYAFLPLNSLAQDNVRHSLYCALPMPTAGGMTVDAAVIQMWYNSIATPNYPGFLLVGTTNFQQQIAEHIIATYSVFQWGEWAQQASGQQSTICSGYGCPFP